MNNKTESRFRSDKENSDEHSSDSELVYMSDLACNCCIMKNESLKRDNDLLRQRLCKQEIQNDSMIVDLKEKDHEIVQNKRSIEKHRGIINDLVKKLNFIESRAQHAESHSQTKEKFYQAELEKLYQVADDSMAIKNLNESEKYKLDRIEGENNSLRKELELIKEEANNSAKQALRMKGELDEVKSENESLKQSATRHQSMCDEFQMLLRSMDTDLNETRTRELQLKRSLNESRMQESKFHKQFVLCQSELSESKRLLEISQERLTVAQKKSMNLEWENEDLQRKMVSKTRQQSLDDQSNSKNLQINQASENDYQKGIILQKTERIEELEKNIAKLRDSLQNRNEEMYKINIEKDDLLKKIRDHDIDLERSNSKKKQLESELDDVKLEATKRKRELEKLKNEINEQMNEAINNKQRISEKEETVQCLTATTHKLEKDIEELKRKLKEKEKKSSDELLELQKEIDDRSAEVKQYSVSIKEKNDIIFRQNGTIEKLRRESLSKSIKDSNPPRIDRIHHQFRINQNGQIDLASELGIGLGKMRKILQNSTKTATAKSHCCCQKNALLKDLDNIIRKQQKILNLIVD